METFETFLRLQEQIAKLQHDLTNFVKQVENWGFYYYTRDRRLKVIDAAREQQLPKSFINKLETIHNQWEEGNFKYAEILEFAECEKNVCTMDTIEPLYKKLHRILWR